MVIKLKRLCTEWEKNFASYTSDKGLITRIHKAFKKLRLPSRTQASTNIGKDVGRKEPL
jgi:hypothetical protein